MVGRKTETFGNQPVHNHWLTDTFQFADEIRGLNINEDDILVSYDVSSLFTNVPLDETIQILADKAFDNNWFNQTHQLNISKSDLGEGSDESPIPGFGNPAASKTVKEYLTMILEEQLRARITPTQAQPFSLQTCWLLGQISLSG